jgi:hypothetical protein
MSGCPHNFGLSDVWDAERIKALRGERGTLEELQICADWQNKVVDQIIMDASVSSVVISFMNYTHLEDELIRKALVNMLELLAGSDKEVVLVLQAPLPEMHMNSYIRNVYRPGASVKGRTKEDWFRVYKGKENLLKELPEEVKVYDPSDIFCDEHDCYVVKDGVGLYIDNSHMSVKGAEMVAKEIVNLLTLN